MAKPKDYVLSVDTGKHCAAALLSHEEGMNVDLIGMYYQHEEAFKPEQVTKLAKNLAALVLRKDVPLDRVDLVIELPSHRYFGRGNSSSLLKAMWQGIRLMYRMAGKVRKVVTIPADEITRGRNDKEKKLVFMDQFGEEEWKELEYYQEKHGSRSNNHERDASLVGLFYIDRIRKGLSMKF